MIVFDTRGDAGRFLREFLRDPLHTAAVAPSSAALAAAMTQAVPTDGAPTVVELGPGTGAFTAAIAARTAGRGRHVAVERHAEWAALLRERYPHVEVVCGDVGDLAAILRDHGVPPADAVVSGLPWAAYRAASGRDLHAVIACAMRPDATFTQFAYSWTRRWAPPARAQLAELRGHFADVRIGRTVWRNLPPAVVYRARRPRDGG